MADSQEDHHPSHHYRSNLRDIEFNLFEVGDLCDHLGSGDFSDLDRETVGDLLREVERLASNEFAASFVEADRRPPELVDGTVSLAPGVKASLDAYYGGGWHLMGVPKELGGYGSPAQVRWAATEMLVGANAATYLFVSGGLMAVVVGLLGTPEQRKNWALPMIERNWGGTMVLTEPDAGSDVGAGTTRAIEIEAAIPGESGGLYHIEGVKRFITSGEQDYSENIVHLVLARREGGGPGTKGLSMFIVPKFLMNADGTLGERNGVVASGLEEKMGIKSSTTTELTFGVGQPCVGYLVGGVHDGIKQMFKIIEDARLLIGTKSMATLSTGYLNALEYAKERIQSADMTTMTDKTSPRVRIIQHPDVRRMLMMQKSHVEGMRALMFYTAWAIDQAAIDPSDDHWERLSDLLLPLLKGYSSEKAYELLGQSLQVFGGSGFTRDYPLEQYIRDVKIDSLYEGTTGIQALDLFFRKIARDQGRTLARLAEEILEFVKGGPEAFERERELLGTALDDVRAHVGKLVEHAMASMASPPEIYKTGLHTNALLESLAEVVMVWLLLRHAEVAAAALPEASGADSGYYEGKIASARFMAKHVLPKVGVRRNEAEIEDGSLMTLPEEAF